MVACASPYNMLLEFQKTAMRERWVWWCGGQPFAWYNMVLSAIFANPHGIYATLARALLGVRKHSQICIKSFPAANSRGRFFLVPHFQKQCWEYNFGKVFKCPSGFAWESTVFLLIFPRAILPRNLRCSGVSLAFPPAQPAKPSLAQPSPGSPASQTSQPSFFLVILRMYNGVV